MRLWASSTSRKKMAESKTKAELYAAVAALMNENYELGYKDGESSLEADVDMVFEHHGLSDRHEFKEYYGFDKVRVACALLSGKAPHAAPETEGDDKPKENYQSISIGYKDGHFVIKDATVPFVGHILHDNPAQAKYIAVYLVDAGVRIDLHNEDE
jgi:hypothetical protein